MPDLLDCGAADVWNPYRLVVPFAQEHRNAVPDRSGDACFCEYVGNFLASGRRYAHPHSRNGIGPYIISRRRGEIDAGYVFGEAAGISAFDCGCIGDGIVAVGNKDERIAA